MCLEIIQIAVKGSAQDIYPIAKAIMKFEYTYFNKLSKASDAIRAAAVNMDAHKISVSLVMVVSL